MVQKLKGGSSSSSSSEGENSSKVYYIFGWAHW